MTSPATRRHAHDDPPARVGAPLMAEFSPPPGSHAHGFRQWLDRERPGLTRTIEAVRHHRGLQSMFVVVNFVHPEEGPAGAIALVALPRELPPRQAVFRRIAAIPYAEMGEYPARWARGETVLVRPQDMPPRLRLRYTANPVGWSLNVPLFIEGEWVGLVGATTRAAPPTETTRAAVTATGEMMVAEHLAETARKSFDSETSRLRLVGKE